MKTRKHHLLPAVMTIAGSDSGGGAGIQADLRTFAWFRVFGTCVPTALTAQNPHRVTGIEAVRPHFIELQIRTVMEEIPVAAVKTGMLFSRPVILAAARALAGFPGEIVVDPVMISTSGKKLLLDSAADALRKHILPLATWITPNLPEAEALAGETITTLDDCKRIAASFAERWNCSVIIKGGHADDRNGADDLVFHNGEFRLFHSERIPAGKNADHGTGCTFSAALTALLARKTPWEQAVLRAKAFVTASLAESVMLSGAGLCAMFPPEIPLAEYEKTISIGKA